MMEKCYVCEIYITEREKTLTFDASFEKRENVYKW